MENYKGEKVVKSKDTPFKDYTASDWALYFIGRYGGIDGSHHKDWVLDQVAMILNGTQVKIKLAEWTDESGKVVNSEYRVSVSVPTAKYDAWVKELIGEADEDGEFGYGYDKGIAP